MLSFGVRSGCLRGAFLCRVPSGDPRSVVGLPIPPSFSRFLPTLASRKDLVAALVSFQIDTKAVEGTSQRVIAHADGIRAVTRYLPFVLTAIAPAVPGDRRADGKRLVCAFTEKPAEHAT